MDKPCTTNQTYGFDLKDEMDKYARIRASKPPKKIGPFDYTRPFSNMGFFPEIPDDRKGLTVGERIIKSAGVLDRKSKGLQNRFDINRGYTMGHIPVSARVRSARYPAEVKLVSFQAIPPVYERAKPKEKDIYLWHSLSGCLVHARNPTEEGFKQIQEQEAS